MDMIEKEVSSSFKEGKVFPPGFRFHPTDEELVLYYLKRKICRRRHRLDVIGETDVYKWDPEELPGMSKLRTGDRQWFFFSPRDRKYPNGGRSNRATRHGYWKATGKDRTVSCNSRSVGVKKTLVFYKGRAPTGERTDWVMHEYTMTEEEMNRCQAEKDYYALYKVYKKSGPGPKNGEQYGAPFQEEEWADEEDNDNNLVQPVDTVKLVEPSTIPVTGDKVNSQLQAHLDDFEEFMNSIASESVPVQPLSVDNGFSLADLVGEEGQSNLVDETSRGIGVLQPSCQQYNGQTCFDVTRSSISDLPVHEVSEVTSITQSHIPPSNIDEGDLEDFLELNDLIGPEPNAQHLEKPTQVEGYASFDEFFDGLGEFELYQDLAPFLSEGEVGDPGGTSQPFISNLQKGGAIPFLNTGDYNFEKDAANLQQARFHNQGDTDMSQWPLDKKYIEHSPGQAHQGTMPQANFYNQGDENILHWSQDQRCIVHTPGQAHQGTMPLATTGVVYDSNSAKHQTGASINNGSKQDDGTDSWFSSSLWAFVESIPTTPASAAETALVNRAFERMSSFGRVSLNSSSMDVAAGSNSKTSVSSGKRRNRLFCFSLFGILCAVLWMFMGTAS